MLGKTNVTELGGLFDANLPEGYCSLGGQVLLPSDTDKTPAGSSAGSAAATAAGLAALTIGPETSTDTAQLIAPAGVAGVVGLKPTVGAVSAATACSPSPSRRTRRARSPARSRDARCDRVSTPCRRRARPGPTTRASADRARGKRSRSSTPRRRRTRPRHRAAGRGRDDRVKTIGTPARTRRASSRAVRARPQRLPRPGTPGGASSLQGIVDYNTANPVEGLKYQQGELTPRGRRPDLSALRGRPRPRARRPTPR